MAVYKFSSDDSYQTSGGFDYYVPDETEPLDARSPDDSRRETEKELSGSLNLRSSRKRFLVLALYILTASFQTYANSYMNSLNMISSVPETVQPEIADVTVSYLSLIFFVSCFLLSHPFSHLLARVDLKNYIVVSSFVSAVVLCVRCVFTAISYDYNNKVGIYITQIPLSIAACMILVCPPQISLRWFPANERRSATGLSLLSLYLGVSIGFITDCWIILRTRHAGNLMLKFRYYQMIHAILGTVNFLVILAFFPKTSLLNPSILTLSQRLNLRSSLRTLLRRVRFWLTLLCSSILIGCFIFIFYHMSWLVDNLDFFEGETNLPKLTIGSALCMILSVFATFILLRISDKFYRLFPFMFSICILYCIFIASSMSFFHFVHEDNLQMYVYLILGSLCCVSVFVLTPLFAEFMHDFMYPVSEEFSYAIFFSAMFFLPAILSFVALHSEIIDNFLSITMYVLAASATLTCFIFSFLRKTKNKRMLLVMTANRRQRTTNDVITADISISQSLRPNFGTL